MLINSPSSPAGFIVLGVLLVLLGCSEPEGQFDRHISSENCILAVLAAGWRES